MYEKVNILFLKDVILIYYKRYNIKFLKKNDFARFMIWHQNVAIIEQKPWFYNKC